MQRPSRLDRAASWVAEAFSTGNPLAPIPAEAAPRTRAEGERVAFAALAELGLAPCGLRGLEGVFGPVVEGRIVPSGTAIAGLRHPRMSAALLGVLGEALEPGEGSPPVLSFVRAALDVSDSRFTLPPGDVAGRSADLARLGMIAVGEAMPPPPDGVIVEAPGGPVRTDVVLAFAAVAAAARRLGGLPAGAVLVAAGLAPAGTTDDADGIALSFGPLGTVRARLPPPVLGSPG